MKQFLISLCNWVEEGALVLTTMTMTCLAFVQVVLRYGFGSGIIWVEEVNRYLMVYLTFFGAALGVKYARHIRIELIEKIVGPRGFEVTQLAVNLVGAAYSASIAYLAWDLTLRLMQTGQTSPTLQMPVYIASGIMPVAAAIMFMRYSSLFGIGLKRWVLPNTVDNQREGPK
jgi:C4-dicarboxylate transporter, DctQ subunit